MNRKAYPTDVSDEEWAFVASYLSLMTQDAPQREHSLREVFNGLHWVVRSGSVWGLMPHDLPPWAAVYQQTQRWVAAGVFEAIVDDLRALLRVAAGRNEQHRAVIMDSRTLQSTLESGGRGGYDGGKRKKGSLVHIAVDTLGHLLGLVSDPCERTRLLPGTGTCSTSARNYWNERGNCLCGSRVYRRTSRLLMLALKVSNWKSSNYHKPRRDLFYFLADG